MNTLLVDGGLSAPLLRNWKIIANLPIVLTHNSYVELQ